MSNNRYLLYNNCNEPPKVGEELILTNLRENSSLKRVRKNPHEEFFGIFKRDIPFNSMTTHNCIPIENGIEFYLEGDNPDAPYKIDIPHFYDKDFGFLKGYSLESLVLKRLIPFEEGDIFLTNLWEPVNFRSVIESGGKFLVAHYGDNNSKKEKFPSFYR